MRVEGRKGERERKRKKEKEEQRTNEVECELCGDEEGV